MISIQGVLVPVDFSKESVLATKFAASMAREYKAKLYILHVIEPLPGYIYNYLPDEITKNTMQQVRADLAAVVPEGVKKDLQVEELIEGGGPAHHVIVEKAKELGVDVIVIATHGRTGLAHVLMGSVAEHVVRHAPCPVFVIRNPKDKYVYGWE